MSSTGQHPNLVRGTRKRSATRPATCRRLAKVRQAEANSERALQHGVFALAANREDVAIEVAVTFAAFPALDQLRDRRVVELLAMASVSHRRAFLALEDPTVSQERANQLESYESRLAPLVERLERTVQERAQQREREAAAKAGNASLDEWRARRDAS